MDHSIENVSIVYYIRKIQNFHGDTMTVTLTND